MSARRVVLPGALSGGDEAQGEPGDQREDGGEDGGKGQLLTGVVVGGRSRRVRRRGDGAAYRWGEEKFVYRGI